MRARQPISDEPTNAEIVRHIDQLHSCVDNALEKVEAALSNYEDLATVQSSDRHAARNRDAALLGGLTMLLKDRGYEMEFSPEGELERIRQPAPLSKWKALETPATVIGSVLGALGAWKYLWPAIVAAHHAILAAH